MSKNLNLVNGFQYVNAVETATINFTGNGGTIGSVQEMYDNSLSTYLGMQYASTSDAQINGNIKIDLGKNYEYGILQTTISAKVTNTNNNHSILSATYSTNNVDWVSLVSVDGASKTTPTFNRYANILTNVRYINFAHTGMGWNLTNETPVAYINNLQMLVQKGGV